MPDNNPSDPQAPAAATNVQPVDSGDQPSPGESTATTTTTDNPADPKPLSFEEAGAILDEADKKSARRTRDPLADSEETSALDDPAERDPLGANELDELLPDEETETQAENPEEPQPAAEETETPSLEGEAEPEDHEALPKRIRLNLEQLNARDAAIILHARKTGKSLKEAETELFGTSTPEPAKVTETETTPEPELESPEQITAEIEELKATRRKASEEYDAKALVDVTEKIEAAQERLAEAKARQASTASRHEAAVGESMARAQGAYPDAFKPGTALHDAVLADKVRLEKANPAFFNDPEWAETLVYKHAGKLGIPKAEAAKPTATEPKPASKPAAKPQPAKAARPVPGPAPGGRTGADSQSSMQAIRDRLKAAEAKGDVTAVNKIILELEQANAA